MTEEMIFTLLETVRKGTLRTAENVTADIADQLPEGHNNNIRWNLGHIAITMDQLINRPAGEDGLLPKSYAASFANGTSPNDWNDETPSLEEIMETLKEQPRQLKERYGGRLLEPLPQPFPFLGATYETVGDLVAFNYYHEGIHQGVINAQLKALTK